MTRWDAYFLRVAEAAAAQSLCLNRQIGAVLVRNKRILSSGYNGPPEGVPPCASRPLFDDNFSKRSGISYVPIPECPRRMIGLGHGEGREWCPATHAEVNAIINAARVGVNTEGATMYMTCGLPCKNCLSAIINAGIMEIVCTSLDAHDDLTPWILGFGKLKVRVFK